MWMKRIALVAVVAGGIAAAHAATAVGKDIYRQLDLFAQVFERVRANYVEEVPDSKLVENAISGMLSQLDPHSSYMPPEQFKNMQQQTKGEFGGLGIEVTMENGLVKVVSPIEGTPADKAGLEPGDLVLEIDSEGVDGMSLNDAVDKMRGPVGTKVTLKIFRESSRKTFDVTLTRDNIQIRPVRSELQEGGLGYVRVSTFNDHTYDELAKHLSDLVKANGGKPLKGLVLDLRNNPGGLLNQAVKVSDAFLTQGEVVSTRGRIPEQNQRFSATPGDLVNGVPMVVIINGGSASASEIVAGALQDHKRAVILGTKSFGKGSVQTVIPLPDGAGMRLTTARYYTPNDRSIQAEGIVPDIEVKPAKLAADGDGTGFERTEASLRGHLINDKEKGKDVKPVTVTTKGKDKADKTPAKEAPSVNPQDPDYDYQLDRALSVLKGLTIWKQK